MRMGGAPVHLGLPCAHHLLPLVGGLIDDRDGKGLVLGLAIEGKCVLGRAGRDLVDAEPLVCGLQFRCRSAIPPARMHATRGERKPA